MPSSTDLIRIDFHLDPSWIRRCALQLDIQGYGRPRPNNDCLTRTNEHHGHPSPTVRRGPAKSQCHDESLEGKEEYLTGRNAT